ncbi:MAG TPA: GatB/YqeY domain-containing protein [Candidatus Desulfofervidus auxilii]|uniref:GatB/YqeY domain-containing protein n=1 Tax=Desulfofervidus auxilii TaxID=1621989 RepID=A0A7C0U4E9_DESA2|nr:GatB/YqeY domain-containing protein [Candidatus Desulfofervidus auxilii]HDD45335.1 GatB/YqeY domain-containing protein [Candidatus Desulfofervidus auxilii]
MPLYEDIDAHLKEAMKAKNTIALNALRSLRTVIKNREIELRRKLEDSEIIQLVAKQIKQREEAIALYKKGDRPDLVEKEEKEIEVLKQFMPPPISKEELLETLKSIIAEVGATGPQDMGKVMKVAMRRLAGRADGKVVSEKVKELLSQI